MYKPENIWTDEMNKGANLLLKSLRENAHLIDKEGLLTVLRDANYTGDAQHLVNKMYSFPHI